MVALHKQAWHCSCLQAAGAPLGAALLLYLDQRMLEGVMSAALLLVICVHCKLHARVAALLWGSSGDRCGQRGCSAVLAEELRCGSAHLGLPWLHM
jgi:hypothetical protein